MVVPQTNQATLYKMNKDLLKNPEVKAIAEAFATAIQNKALLRCEGLTFDDFVRENTKPKEWEILSVKHGEHEIKIASYITEKEDIHTAQENFIKFVCKGAVIHSVRRNSDGEVFTVSDRIQLKYPFCSPLPTIIKSFEISNDLMVVRSSNISGDYTQDLSNIEKIKQSLFKTIDGKDIYEGDEFYIVVNWLSHSTIATQRHVAFKDGFSTREKAREYVLMNKPCLSVNDVMSFTFSEAVHIKRLQQELTNLAKSKL